MKRLSVTTLMSCLLLRKATCHVAENVRRISGKGRNVNHSETQSRFKKPAPCFAGNVKVDTLLSPIRERLVFDTFGTFKPGARSAWSTRPAGQPPVVTSGTGLVQKWNKPVTEIRPDDIVKCSAGVKYRHGVGPDRVMTYLAVTGDGYNEHVERPNKVTQAHYCAE